MKRELKKYVSQHNRKNEERYWNFSSVIKSKYKYLGNIYCAIFEYLHRTISGHFGSKSKIFEVNVNSAVLV